MVLLHDEEQYNGKIKADVEREYTYQNQKGTSLMSLLLRHKMVAMHCFVLSLG